MTLCWSCTRVGCLQKTAVHFSSKLSQLCCTYTEKVLLLFFMSSISARLLSKNRLGNTKKKITLEINVLHSWKFIWMLEMSRPSHRAVYHTALVRYFLATWLCTCDHVPTAERVLFDITWTCWSWSSYGVVWTTGISRTWLSYVKHTTILHHIRCFMAAFNSSLYYSDIPCNCNVFLLIHLLARGTAGSKVVIFSRSKLSFWVACRTCRDPECYLH